MALLPEGLIDIMQCPACSEALWERVDPPALICERCQLAYPVADGGIPVMLPEAARPLNDADKDA